MNLIFRTKKKARAAMLRRLRSQAPADRRRKSRRILRKLFALGAFKRAKTVCFYVSLPEEVDTRPMIDRAIRMGKRVVVPLSDLENKELGLFEISDRRRDLKQGAFGILEPDGDFSRRVRPGELDLAVVPGVAFDSNGRRLGRGMGFYDRFLSRWRVPSAGLAFSFQVVTQLPTGRHDRRVDHLLTD